MKNEKDLKKLLRKANLKVSIFAFLVSLALIGIMIFKN